MEPPGQLLGRPLQPASRIQGRAQELPGPPGLLQEQGPREVGCHTSGSSTVSEARGSRAASPRNGSRSLARWASYGAPRATPGTTATASFSNTRPSTRTAWSPSDYSKNKALGTWVGNQRTQYRLRSEGKKSQLTEARIEDLSKAGFVWRVKGKKK